MAENQTIKERLILYIKFLGIGQGKFEAQCGLSNGYVNNIRKSITPEKLQMIARRNPDLNTGWLMTGEGEMLNQSAPTTEQQGDNFSRRIIETLIAHIDQLKEQLQTMNCKCQEQEKYIEELQREIDNETAQK